MIFVLVLSAFLARRTFQFHHKIKISAHGTRTQVSCVLSRDAGLYFVTWVVNPDHPFRIHRRCFCRVTKTPMLMHAHLELFAFISSMHSSGLSHLHNSFKYLLDMVLRYPLFWDRGFCLICVERVSKKGSTYLRVDLMERIQRMWVSWPCSARSRSELRIMNEMWLGMAIWRISNGHSPWQRVMKEYKLFKIDLIP